MKLKSIFYSLLIASLTSTAFAQVKIGNNPGTITSTSNLEVESSTGTKVVVDKTTGNLGAGVTDPSQSIDGAGTARLRNIPTSTTNNLILTVDANGVVAKQNAQAAQLPVVLGVLGSGIDLTPNAAAGALYTGAYVILPANSKYIITANILLVNSVIQTNSSAFVRGAFTDSPSAGAPLSSDVVGTSLISGTSTPYSVLNMLTGSVTIANTSASPKTYYFVARASSNGGTFPAGYYLKNFASNNTIIAENQIYGIPVN